MLICSHIVYGCFLTMSEPSSYKGNHVAGKLKYFLFGLLSKKFAGLCSRGKLWVRVNNGKFGQHNDTKRSLMAWAPVGEGTVVRWSRWVHALRFLVPGEMHTVAV